VKTANSDAGSAHVAALNLHDFVHFFGTNRAVSFEEWREVFHRSIPLGGGVKPIRRGDDPRRRWRRWRQSWERVQAPVTWDGLRVRALPEAREWADCQLPPVAFKEEGDDDVRQMLYGAPPPPPRPAPSLASVATRKTAKATRCCRVCRLPIPSLTRTLCASCDFLSKRSA